MLWKGRRESGRVLDRRSVGGVLGGGSLIIAVIYALMTGDPSAVIDSVTSSSSPSSEKHSEEAKQFVSVVLADTEDVWNKMFSDMGRTYAEPNLILFSRQTSSACGRASSAVGPFYCPGDKQVYIDLNFLDTLQEKLGAKGDFARAYVIAHEVGHHVQNLLGFMPQGGAGESNEKSVQIELQADCLAGVWAHETNRTKQVLEPGDIDEALGAAAAVGDDHIQKVTQGSVVPDSFTHGSSKQRVASFTRGFQGGSLRDCDTKISMR
jgi:predicted metalloprotease